MQQMVLGLLWYFFPELFWLLVSAVKWIVEFAIRHPILTALIFFAGHNTHIHTLLLHFPCLLLARVSHGLWVVCVYVCMCDV